MKAFFNKGIMGLIALALVAGCESKVTEQDPQGVDAADVSVKDRLSANDNIDDKLSQIQRSIFKIKNIIDLFKQQINSTTYTPVDFAIDLTDELKKGLPEGDSGHYEKKATFKIPISSLSPNCQKVQAEFIAQPPETIKTYSDDIILSDVATMNIKTCYNDSYVKAFEMTTIGTSVSINIHTEALQKLIFGMLPNLDQVSSNCQLSVDPQGVVSKVTCSNLAMDLGNGESAVLQQVTYDLNGDIRLDCEGKVYDSNNLVKRTISEKFDKNMHLVVD